MTDRDGGPGPGTEGHDRRRRAIAAEQAHLDRVHARVERVRADAERAAASVQGGRLGSTFQAVYERDVLSHHHAGRAARLAVGDFEAIVLGRLDTVDGASRAVGRLSVTDADGTRLVMDWRAPAAAAFYRATSAEPLGVARRRVLVTDARTVVDLDDELLDVEAADRLGIEAVTGQGALLASLQRARTPHMRDVVATIRAEQDRIVRAPALGTLIVTGGPGTGKTVVALHRVAYLLYEQRDRLGPRGVLVVGPSRAFTSYTSRVLPALGEDRVVQRPLEALAPVPLTVDGWDPPAIGALKGDLRMVGLCRRLLLAALPPVPPETRLGHEGTAVVVRGADVLRLRERALARVTGERASERYHARRASAEAALRDLCWQRWRQVRAATGSSVPEDRTASGFDESFDDAPAVRMLLRCYWPEVDPEAALQAVVDGTVDLERVGRGTFPDEDLARLAVAWRSATAWHVDDVAVIDELAAIAGPVDPTDEDGATDLGDPWYRDFGHVVVDEAQDLSPLQWRSVARRGSWATWTIVGDLLQRSRVSEPRTWEAIAALVGRRRVEVATLAVNYRSPAEVAPVARAVLAAAGHDPEAFPAGVRATGVLPRLVIADDPVAAGRGVVEEVLAATEGTVGVVAVADVLDGSAPDTDAGRAAEADGRLRRLVPRAVKGLEFDEVVVIDPAAIATASPVGLHDLYVAITRATRSLTVVARAPGDLPGAEHLEVRPRA